MKSKRNMDRRNDNPFGGHNAPRTVKLTRQEIRPTDSLFSLILGLYIHIYTQIYIKATYYCT